MKVNWNKQKIVEAKNLFTKNIQRSDFFPHHKTRELLDDSPNIKYIITGDVSNCDGDGYALCCYDFAYAAT